MFARIVWSSATARRGRLMLALLAVTLGVAVSTALATLALQVGDDLARSLRAAGPNFVMIPAGARLPLDLGGAALEPPRAGLALADTAVAELKQTFWKNNILDASPELTVAAAIERAPVTLTGAWFTHDVAVEGATWQTGLAPLHPRWTLEGRWPAEDRNELAVGRELATRLGLEPGRAVTLALGDRPETWTVSGVVSAGGADDGRAWAPLARVQALAARPHQVDRVWLSALVLPPPRTAAPDPERDPKGFERFSCTAYPANVAGALAERVAGTEVLPMTEVVAGEGVVVGRLNLLMLLLALAALTASILGLLSTSMAAVIERGVELGLLRAIGATSRQIAALLLGETVLVSLAGGVIGWALGTAVAMAIRGGTFGTAAFSPLLLPLALLVSLGVALLGTIAPLRVALRLEPTEALRG